MIPEWGHAALWLALWVAMLLGALPWVQALPLSARMQAMRRLAVVQCALVSVGMLTLMVAFFQNDLSVVYVASHSHALLPWYYRIAAVWGAHEGSFLLWLWILSLWCWVVSRPAAALSASYQIKMVSVLGGLGAGFTAFVLFASNPFLRFLPWVPQHGQELNPLLQDPGLVVHPPILYTGYVGFAVAFAMAMAALWEGRFDAAWARWARPWVLLAWGFLTYGIVIGSWWAYRELGWGGWWFWDPVENASLMPWLAGSALVHALMMVERLDRCQAWTVCCAMLAFSMSLLGTFLVRSGVLVSVHAFAIDPTRGIFMLAYLGLVVGLAFALFAWRAPKLMGSWRMPMGSREHLLWVNNTLLLVMLGTVLLGTLYPLLYAAMGWGRLSVGAPYFNAVMVPLAVALMALMVLAPFTRWQQTLSVRATAWTLGSLVVLCVVFAVVGSIWHWAWRSGIGIACALWIIATLGAHARQYWHRSGRFTWSAPWGMWFAHLGVAVMVVGISITVQGSHRYDLSAKPGDRFSVGAYEIVWEGLVPVAGHNYRAVQANLELRRAGERVAYLHPQQRVYEASRVDLAKTAIDAGVFRDVYVALGQAHDDGQWTLRVYIKPFVRWVWAGGFLMILGALLAAIKRWRRR